MEEYKGVKFKVVYVHGAPPSGEKLIELGKILSKYIKTKRNEGNVSARFGEGFLISPAGARLTKLAGAIYVTNVVVGQVWVMSGTPSSESIMHWEIYENRRDANIILHFHDEEILKKEWKGIEIGPFEYGTIELAKAVGEASKKVDIIKIKEHGFVIIAEDEEDLIRKLKEVCL